MVRIENFNTSANLVYLQDYLTQNFDFEYLMVELDCLCLQFNTEPTEAETTQILNYYNNIEEVDWLQSYKLQRFEEINERTSELIEDGYTYGGFQFSLSEVSQTNILALYSTKDDPILIYPIKFNTMDDLNTFEAVNASEIANMYYSALATKKGFLDSGTGLKDQVRSATTQNEIDSINDNR